MVIFKCPYCRTEYEMTMARLSYQTYFAAIAIRTATTMTNAAACTQ